MFISKGRHDMSSHFCRFLLTSKESLAYDWSGYLHRRIQLLSITACAGTLRTQRFASTLQISLSVWFWLRILIAPRAKRLAAAIERPGRVRNLQVAASNTLSYWTSGGGWCATWHPPHWPGSTPHRLYHRPQALLRYAGPLPRGAPPPCSAPALAGGHGSGRARRRRRPGESRPRWAAAGISQ